MDAIGAKGVQDLVLIHIHMVQTAVPTTLPSGKRPEGYRRGRKPGRRRGTRKGTGEPTQGHDTVGPREGNTGPKPRPREKEKNMERKKERTGTK